VLKKSGKTDEETMQVLAEKVAAWAGKGWPTHVEV